MEAPPKGLNPVTDLPHLALRLEGICVGTVLFMMNLIPHPGALVLFLVKAKIFYPNGVRYNFCCLKQLKRLKHVV
jgi:hypothetical protein